MNQRPITDDVFCAFFGKPAPLAFRRPQPPQEDLHVTHAPSKSAAAAKPPVSIGVAPSKIQANLIPGQLYKTDLDIFN